MPNLGSQNQSLGYGHELHNVIVPPVHQSNYAHESLWHLNIVSFPANTFSILSFGLSIVS